MRKLAILMGGCAIVAATAAYADNTDTKNVDVTGSLKTSLTFAAGTPSVTMPNLVVPDTASSTTSVQLVCPNSGSGSTSVTYSGNGNPFARGSAGATTVDSASSNRANAGTIGANFTGACADLTVNGENNFYFSAQISGLSTATTGTRVSAATCTSDGGTAGDITTTLAHGFQLSGTGSKTLRCGATVTTDAITGGTYTLTSAYTVTVTYD